MDDRIFVLDLLLVKLESAACNIGPTKNSSKVNDTFSGLTNYQVKTIDVVDSRVATINTEQSGQTLVLVTCYPFDAVVTGGPLRYVVTADAL